MGLGLGLGRSLNLFVQDELDQFLDPGRLRVEADLLSAGQTRYDFSVGAVGSFRHQLDAPQSVRGDDPGLELHTAAVAVVFSVDRGHPISEDEECPEHHRCTQLHVPAGVSQSQ